MDSHKPWLRAEIAQWLRDGLIDDQQAAQLYARYPLAPQQAPRAWGKLIFAAIGAVVFGLGVILLFAYNWEAMHRYTKLSAVAGGFATSHLLAWWWRQDPRLAEVFHLLGTMLFGGALWLIAQIYHVDVNYPEGFMLWSAAAVAMAWVLPSTAHGILACLLICGWTAMQVFAFERPHLPGTAALLLGLLPLAWQQRSTLLLRAVLVLLPVSLLFNSWIFDSDIVLLHAVFIAAIYLWAERLAPVLQWRESVPALHQTGLLLWWACLLLLSIQDVSWAFSVGHRSGDALLGLAPAQLISASMLLVIVVFAGLCFGRSSLRPRSGPQWLELACLALPLLVLCASYSVYPMPVAVQFSANIALLAYALLFVYRGSEYLMKGSLSAGGVLLTLLLLLRFNDLFHSLLARASLFLLLGTLLILAGLRFSRQQERQKLGVSHAR
ncbi:DUF2157 domain-containing protein [uncultured Spongiibacter sp.]|uniref:DUF2157 domain-containing protein n=1 Tax=uncultured Spongiibacter sp. TaxID=870896 RepID=UPI0025874B4D|nr:DUF2157 domain-containing protein [uncultured Spongiibacter sp.]